MSKPKIKILVADDESIIRKAISLSLGDTYDIVEADDYESTIAAYENNDISLTILDINFNKNMNGLDALKRINEIDKNAPVIILSMVSDTQKVVDAIKLGAFDYIVKSPSSIETELMLRIEKSLRLGAERRTFEVNKVCFGKQNKLVSVSNDMKRILREIEDAGSMNILIEGETGVGKTPIAMYANFVLAGDGDRPFVRINCAGLSRERLQDELFGHKKSAFTGAESDKKGLVELAEDGDLFLDEIGDLDLSCQAELLMFLDSGEFRRLGDPIIRYSNCRVIAATNHNLKQRVNENKFRIDLYSRIAPCKIIIPPLRTRKEDIAPIVIYFISYYCGYGKICSQQVIELYTKFDWMEGNVRELRDAVRYMCQKSHEDETIELRHVNSCYFSEEIIDSAVSAVNVSPKSIKEEVLKCGFDNYLSYIEKKLLKELAAGEKSVRALAKKLNIVDVTLHRKFKKYNITLDS